MRLPVRAAFAPFYVARCEEAAGLLASKSLLNRYAVEDRAPQYTVGAAGSGAALNTELSNGSLPSEDFGVLSGMFNVKQLQIAGASDVPHAEILRLPEAAYFNFASAAVACLAREGGQALVGFTSAPGQGGILAQRELDGRFSPRLLDRAAFGVMTLPSVGLLLLWDLKKRKYDTRKTEK
ncbi:PREDICTED: LOW QUALITY PROTEIN: translocon-associated protein subunit beta-like [Pygoscelis adeliae]|uniref:LOW QUALITY PROTEIN: translocon-associated protein subunit beta-like n=1 Tax=Pygoscelis adeliae TaxID=9238 RepID=UPI0004F4F4DA|nr:PREDICTED: LOW QUALITY PROTEIN: translocon-associated protein subunit beta-like [Pygoscelis adeliae]